jgi:hypothetical protein
MYVTLKLDSTDHPNMADLAKELHQILGVYFDGLLLRRKDRATHASWMEIHTGGSGLSRNINRDRALALVQSYLPEVKDITSVDHFGGLAYNFTADYDVYVCRRCWEPRPLRPVDAINR